MAAQRCLSCVLLMLLPLQVVAAEGHDSSATRESTANTRSRDGVRAPGDGAELDDTTADADVVRLGPEALVVWSTAKRTTARVSRVVVLEMSPLGSVAVTAYRQAGLPLQLYATYIGAQLLDWGTTRVALRHGAVEANPIMLFAGAGGLGGMALNTATTFGVIHLIRRLGRKHPKVATRTLLALSAATAGMSVSNIQNIR